MRELNIKLSRARRVLGRPNAERDDVLHAAREIAEVATSAIIGMRKGMTIDNPFLRATGYKTQYDIDNHEMLICLYHGAESNVIAWMTLPSDEVYTLSNKCMSIFDKLEGVD